MATRGAKRNREFILGEEESIDIFDGRLSVFYGEKNRRHNYKFHQISISDSEGERNDEPPAKRQNLQTNDDTSIPRILDGKYFKIENRDGVNVEAVCTQCLKRRKGNTKSTGNFMMHYKLEHKELVAEVNLYKKQKTDTTKQTSLRQTTLPRFITVPMQIVSDPSFVL